MGILKKLNRNRFLLITGNIFAYALIIFLWVNLNTPKTKIPVSTLSPHITMRSIELKVNDMKSMENFYTKLIGMQVLSKNKNSESLGYDGKSILVLDYTPELNYPSLTDPGLDQIAIVFSSRSGLAKTLERVINSNPSLYIGGTDRGAVGEAFYVADPQGNSLELYYDTNPATWPRTVNGNIEGKYMPIIADQYIRAYSGLEGSNSMELGHLQIRIGDLQQGKKFYLQTLGFYPIPQITPSNSVFMSDGFYHHDLVINQAQGYDGDKIDKYLGLKGFSFNVENYSDLNRLKSRLLEENINYSQKGNLLTFKDPWGLIINVGVTNPSIFNLPL